ncbi:MAG: glutamine--fructose-6-phosphate transaminase (isomerizing) [Halobacteriota archaeon]|nr:glutamine--fructose-6-phosphate transaminase (isomerizing) [Halobacteriota archaeon]
MCGITAYIGEKEATPILLDSLKRLEYRGYDSAGIAVINGKEIFVHKMEGEIDRLCESIPRGVSGNVGIAHTRWATHGAPSKINAHPHISGDIALVHNGIIENYQHLMKHLIKEGYDIVSETDTEVLAHLINHNYDGNIEAAVHNSLLEVDGSYAIAVICGKEPDRLITARKDSPLVIGVGRGENFIASDIPAIANHSREVIYLDDGEIASIGRDYIDIKTLDGSSVNKKVHTVDWDVDAAEKAGYEHFMLKEIHEQPDVIRNTIAGRLSELEGTVQLQEVGLSIEEIEKLAKIRIIACGTSYHAGMLGKYLFENLSRIPVEVDIASEFRYSDAILDKNTLVLAITQSGETADTLAALKDAKSQGYKTFAITNVVGSSVCRSSDGVLYTRAGPEIGVAATKTFTAQLIAIYLLSMYFGKIRKTIDSETLKLLISLIKQLPKQVQMVIENSQTIQLYSKIFSEASKFFFIGRSYDYPIALEGALKLKEISYIHAEGYPAGELKHGPLALLETGVPMIAIATKGHTYEKMLSNIKEVKARDAYVLAIASEEDIEIEKYVDDVLRVPETNEILSPVLSVVVAQIFAYYCAKERGCEVDKPRNLAKSVTVE